MSKRRDFERFARMRVEGRSDLLYRAYDLLRDEGIYRPVQERTLARYIGYEYTVHQPNHFTYQVQADLRNAGLGVVPLTTCLRLLREFYRYDRIKDGHGRFWPRRNKVEVRALWAQNQAALERLTKRAGYGS